VSNSTNSTPNKSAVVLSIYGSYAIIFSGPKPFILVANAFPMFPRPIIPTTLPAILPNSDLYG